MFFLIPANLRIAKVRPLATVAVTVLISFGMSQNPRSARGQAVAPKNRDGGKSSQPVFHKVGRGDVIVTVVERGSIESIENAAIACKLRNNERGVASTIKWLIEEGTSVKKGDKVAELDDSALREQVGAQETIVAERKALLEQAVKERELAAEQGKLEVETAQDNIAIAELEVQEAADKDKGKTEIRLRQAKRAAKMAKLQADTHLEKAQAALTPRQVALDAELAKLADLKEQLAACVLIAPREGIVIYSTSDSSRWGIGREATVVGEPVRQGQVLMTIPDPRRLQVVLKIPETEVTRLRPTGRQAKPAGGQQARIRIDAFPGRMLKGQLQTVAPKAEPALWSDEDIKRFHSTVVLLPDQKIDGLKPGMTGEVTIYVDERKNVLRIPAQAVLIVRGDRICYVKGDDGTEERRLSLGESNDVFVEVKDGLKEGEEVVLNPQPIRVPQKPPARGQGRLPPFGATDVLVRSVRPTEPKERRSIERYGLTLADLVRIEEIVPGTVVVAPLRRMPTITVRTPLTANHQLDVVATTRAYGVVHGLDDYLVDESHRFLADLDQERFATVAVLGAEAARKLFPRDEPIGQTIKISGHPFRVVGVLRERPTPVEALNRDSDVYIPLAASRQTFGKLITVRMPGTFRIEEVDFSEIQLVLRDRRQIPQAAAAIRGMLEHYHDQQDWQVLAPFD